MKNVNIFCESVTPFVQISILSSLDKVVNQVNKTFSSNIELVDKETFFSDHVLFIAISSFDVIFHSVIDSFICRVEKLMSRHNVFGHPYLFNVDFVNKVVNIVVKFD